MMEESKELEELNKKIGELKKKVILCEGQKKANLEEWEKQKRANADTISTLKKEIKDLTSKLTFLKNPTCRKSLKQPQEVIRRYQLPVGAQNAKEAVSILDLKVIDLRKQIDLVHDKYLKRQKYFNKLVEQYKELLSYKNNQSQDFGGPPPETVEEDENRKLVCHLENEIHRTNVQWMEAEHIRKKYRSIKASLMNDAERFERSLKELEEALAGQQAEIRRLQDVNKEAIDMRDAAKIILQRQEQLANVSHKARERQAVDFRKQVDDRRLELERIERKLFSAGKSLVHQESIGSSSGDQQTGKTELDDDPDVQMKRKNEEMDVLFKNLMEITGATTAEDVLERFLSQKESSSRLTYLRTAAEAEKKHLEEQRDLFISEIEEAKFSEMKEIEINQEQLEKVKTEIKEIAKEMEENLNASEKTKNDIQMIRDALTEMIFKLQEVDEMDIFLPKSNKSIAALDLADYVAQTANSIELIAILEEKLKRTLIATGQMEPPVTEAVDEELLNESEMILNMDELYVPIASPRAPSIIDEKPQPLPTCYINLLTGRGAQTSSATPGQTPQQQAAATDDESEVPSRTFLKRQAQLIVDAKSRRKGFRVPAQRRK